MKHYIDKNALVAEIKRLSQKAKELYGYSQFNTAYDNVLKSIDILEVKEVSNEKTKWSPSKKQMKSLKDMLRYNIGVFDYQKFMEVNSLYDDLIKILDYETDRQE